MSRIASIKPQTYTTLETRFTFVALYFCVWCLGGGFAPSLSLGPLAYMCAGCRCSVRSRGTLLIQLLCSLRLSPLTTRPLHPQFLALRQDGRKQRPPENNVLAIKLRVGEYVEISGTFKTTRDHVEVSGKMIRVVVRLCRDYEGIVWLGTIGRCSGTQHHCFCCMGRNEGLRSGS